MIVRNCARAAGGDDRLGSRDRRRDRRARHGLDRRHAGRRARKPGPPLHRRSWDDDFAGRPQCLPGQGHWRLDSVARRGRNARSRTGRRAPRVCCDRRLIRERAYTLNVGTAAGRGSARRRANRPLAPASAPRANCDFAGRVRERLDAVAGGPGHPTSNTLPLRHSPRPADHDPATKTGQGPAEHSRWPTWNWPNRARPRTLHNVLGRGLSDAGRRRARRPALSPRARSGRARVARPPGSVLRPADLPRRRHGRSIRPAFALHAGARALSARRPVAGRPGRLPADRSTNCRWRFARSTWPFATARSSRRSGTCPRSAKSPPPVPPLLLMQAGDDDQARTLLEAAVTHLSHLAAIGAAADRLARCASGAATRPWPSSANFRRAADRERLAAAVRGACLAQHGRLARRRRSLAGRLARRLPARGSASAGWSPAGWRWTGLSMPIGPPSLAGCRADACRNRRAFRSGSRPTGPVYAGRFGRSGPARVHVPAASHPLTQASVAAFATA